MEVKLQLTRPQYKFIFSEAKFPSLIGGLGSGKSQGGTYRIARLMLSDPGINCAYYFPTYDLITLRGIPGLIKDLESLGYNESHYSINKSSYTVTIKGYGDVIFRSYDCPERIVAYEVAHSIVDELDTLPKAKADLVWRKVVERNRQHCNHSAGNTVGCVTTPDQGQLGFVFEKWGGELQEGYELIKASTYSNPFLPPGYADNIKKNYDEDLAQLYLEGEFVSLAFRTVFGRKDMQRALKECWKPIKRMVMESDKFVERENGELRVWSEPQTSKRYVIGADTAMGIEGGDYSVADVREVSEGLQVAHWHGKASPDKFGYILMALGKYYNNALIGCEVNNHGLTTNIIMRDAGYSNLYVQKALQDRGSNEKETRKLGWNTTSKSKPHIIDQLSAELREGTDGICCKETISEMMTYVVDESGSYNASDGSHDDRVMSYAICSEMLRTARGNRHS